MVAASLRFIGRPSLGSEGGSANFSANGEANPGSNLADGLAEARAAKACEMRLSASRLLWASVSADACLSLVFSIMSETCFE